MKAVYAPCVLPAPNRKLARRTVNPVPLARYPSPVDLVPDALLVRQVTQTRPHAPPARLEDSWIQIHRVANRVQLGRTRIKRGRGAVSRARRDRSRAKLVERLVRLVL